MLLLDKENLVTIPFFFWGGGIPPSPVFMSDELKERDKENKRVKYERSTNFHPLSILIYYTVNIISYCYNKYNSALHYLMKNI